MATNRAKKKPAPTPASFIAALPASRRADVERLDTLIRRAAPELAPQVSGAMLGYGRYRYRYESGREGESFRIALASRAAGISLYVSAFEDGAYLAEREATRLGKVAVGKSCIRFKKLEDLDVRALGTFLAKAARTPAAGEITLQ